MAKGSLIIVANDEARNALVDLARPSAEISVRGTIQQEGGQTILAVQSIESSGHTNLDIVANECIRRKLSDLASAKNGQEVAIEGRITEVNGRSALVLDDAASVTSLPILASESAQQQLADLASNGGGGEITVRAKVSGKGVNRVLVLESR